MQIIFSIRSWCGSNNLNQPTLYQALERLTDCVNFPANHRIRVEFRTRERTWVARTKPLKHPVGDTAGGSVPWIDLRSEVSHREAQVVFHAHDQRSARPTSPRFFDGDDPAVLWSVPAFDLLLRGLLKSPRLINSVTDG
jgi:hypothetical protein